MRQHKKILLAVAVAVAVAAALGGAALAGATSGDDNALTGSALDRASSAALAATGGGTLTDSERDSEHGATYEVEVTKDGQQSKVRLDDAFKVVAVERDHEDADDDTSDQPLTGSTLARASKAALAKTGGGKVTGSERDAEDGAVYEIEVTKPDGSQIDVQLDGAFHVVTAEPDHED